MEERRKAPRMPEENQVTITINSEENDLSQEKIRDVFIDNYTKDISAFGAGIKTNICLPVDTLIELEFTSKGLREQIKTLAKVKWVKVIIQDESYEAGVEFCGVPNDAIKKLDEYISWKLKERLNKKGQSPIDSSAINKVETKEHPPIKSKEITKAETKEQLPIKNKQWIKMVTISLCTIILIVALLKIFGYIPEFDRSLVTNIMTKATPPAPVIKATPVPEVKATPVPVPKIIPAPETKTTPVPEAKQKIKVIGNSDSKRYHLPGMKYYNAVKAYHRVEFDSEADAIKAGYNKAPQ